MKEVTLEQMKEFALSKIYPYYAGLKPFGYDAITGKCVYKNVEGNCCIAGAEMLPEVSEYWSTDSLTKNIEIKLNSLSQEGYEIISVSVGINMWWFPTAYITVSKDL